MEDNNKENGIKKSYIILLVITISFIVGLIVLVGTTDLRAYNNAKKLYAKVRIAYNKVSVGYEFSKRGERGSAEE